MVYRFGNLSLDVDARQLLRGDDEIHLAPKAFELLAMLIRNRSRAMAKGELLETLWPATFVEETGLASLIAEIRRAIGDSATTPVYVRTIHRFGYRFVGDLIETSVPAPVAPCRTRRFLVFENRKTMLLEGVNVIGREPDATIQCDAPGVSRHHAQILVSADNATLEDLGSKNGTYVQGERITSARLSDGDEIRVGNATLIFRIDPPLDPTETVAPNSKKL